MNKVKAWQTTDGQTFTTLAAAQGNELISILCGIDNTSTEVPPITDKLKSVISQHLIENAEKVVNILTLKDGSHPKARKAAGATRKKKGAAGLFEPVPGT